MTGLTWKVTLIVFVTICLFKASARSEDNTEVSAGTRQLAPLPFQLVLPREHLQPDLQYIIRPGGTGQLPDALVLGAQVGVNF